MAFSGHRLNTRAFAHARMHTRAVTRCYSLRHCCAAIVPACIYRCCVTRDRESYASRVPIVFSARPARTCAHTRACQNAGCSRHFVVPPNVDGDRRTFHAIPPFFGIPRPRRDSVGPPHILDSAVLISELRARRGNSHSKNGFFRPSGAVMER